jgi:hypothetical protein
MKLGGRKNRDSNEKNHVFDEKIFNGCVDLLEVFIKKNFIDIGFGVVGSGEKDVDNVVSSLFNGNCHIFEYMNA